jgi:Uma2 family endonuclease
MVIDPTQQRFLSVEEWVKHPDADQYELIDGVLRARMVNQNYHEFAVGRAAYVLNDYLLRSGEMGSVFTSNTKYRVRARRGIMPDVSVILGSKAEAVIPDAAFNSVGPDLAIEVLSPDQGADYVEERLEDYWKLGTMEVWIVEPDTKTVTGYIRGPQEFSVFSRVRDDEEFHSRLLERLRFPVSLFRMR